MYKQVSGYIKLDDQHVIIHNKPRFHNFSFNQLQALCNQAFPDMFRNHGWVQEVRFSISAETNLDNVPSWFTRAIKESDSSNNWTKLPFVALVLSKGGIIDLKPFS